ncbi:MAG: type I glyceraldehyde-3-phosphate dehydrogenase [Candidatus Symbiobacter sp.]|nr:type I glyceraldehyde-3-phosphate dehydrogenase [Candidatus Symbiobacter sp.]
MAIKLAINGFGRIGRLVLRAMLESKRTDVEIVAINDLGSVATNAHLLQYDSVHGRVHANITTGADYIDIDGRRIHVTAERDPANLPWQQLGIDIALECTGLFTKREAAAKHLTAGARRVLISAPGEEVDYTTVFGVNTKGLSQDHVVVSNASCTTNCLAPVAMVLNQTVGIERGYMTTIHAYTGDQPTVDSLHKDLRRARAAALSMIPTTTGAAKAVGLVLPELKGKLDGTSIRVPTPNVSLIDLTFDAKRDCTVAEINQAMQDAANGALKGVLAYNEAPLVSSDFNHVAASSSFDATQTVVMDKRFGRILSWYDNEWGFSNRMLDTAAAMGKLL